MNNNYYGIYESIEPELIEAMNSALDGFNLDIDTDGIDLLNSNLTLKFSTTGHLSEEDLLIEELESVFSPHWIDMGDIDTTTATTLVQNYPELSLQDIQDFNRGYEHSYKS